MRSNICKSDEGFEVTWLGVNDGGWIDPDELDASDATRHDAGFNHDGEQRNWRSAADGGNLAPLSNARCLAAQRHGAIVRQSRNEARRTSMRRVLRAHKVYGPKGAGLLYLRAGLPIEAIQFGGAHENQRRPGTENVPAIVGMAAADENDDARSRRGAGTRKHAARSTVGSRFIVMLLTRRLNGDTAHRLANTLNVSFPGIELGNDSDGARSGRGLRFERLGLHGRFGGRVPCLARDGIASSAG